MTSTSDADRLAFLGGLVADAVAMPVHWYYDQRALDRDYGTIAGYLAPRSPHPDSILWRSTWTPPAPQFDILRDQAAFWGKRGVHYHQFLAAGENTLNSRLAVELYDMVRRDRDYDPGIRRLFGWWPLTEGHVPVFWTLGGAPEGMHITLPAPMGLWACHILSGARSRPNILGRL